MFNSRACAPKQYLGTLFAIKQCFERAFMARQREFDKAEVIDRAIGLFWAKGYESTSIRDLKEAMGISSSSMYEAFGSKRGVFLAALERFCEVEREGIARMAQDAATPQQFIERLFAQVDNVIGSAAHIKGPDEGPIVQGSMAFNTMVEFGTLDADITKLLLTHYFGIADIVAGLIAQGQQDGTVTNDEAPLNLAYTILSTLHGVATLKGVKPDFTYVRAVTQVIIKLLSA
jgi:TetR/AcrR family transcriptional repressor of nem operon